MHEQKINRLAFFILLGTFLSACISAGEQEVIEMKIASPAFKHGEQIPKKYTCEGEDASPPLSFAEIPGGAKSLALVVDDPDAPGGTFDHWIVWDIAPEQKELKEGEKVEYQGRNDFGELRYRGPCPPRGRVHRYFFRLYALDATLNLPNGASREELEKAMQNHILAKAELVGTYKR